MKTNIHIRRVSTMSAAFNSEIKDVIGEQFPISLELSTEIVQWNDFGEILLTIEDKEFLVPFNELLMACSGFAADLNRRHRQ